MAKAVLISIRPEWVEKIANGWKTIEVRKTKPYLETPFKCYIYCTNTRPHSLIITIPSAPTAAQKWIWRNNHGSGYENTNFWSCVNGRLQR